MKTNAEQKTKEQPKALHWAGIPLRSIPASELGRAVEKVNLARIRPAGRKCDLSGCSVYGNLILGKNQETPENHPLHRPEWIFLKPC